MKTKELKKFMQKANKIYNTKKNELPVMDKIKINNGFMTIGNLETFLIYPCDFTLKTGLVDFPFLKKIIQKTKTDEIDLSLKNENQILIKTGTSSFIFTENIQVDDFPNLPELKDPVVEKLSIKDIQRIKKSVNYSANDDLRPVRNTVCIDPGHIVATDGNKVAFHKRDLPGKNQVILDKKTVGLLDDDFEYTIQKGKSIHVSNEKYTVIQYQDFYDHQYPSWKSVIPQEHSIAVHGIQTKPLIEALQESGIAANQSTNLVKMYVDPARKIINLQATDLDFGISYNCNLSVEKIEGEPIIIGIKGTFLLEILQTEKLEKINLFMQEPHRAIRINNDLLLMPILLGDIYDDETIEPNESELNEPIKK